MTVVLAAAALLLGGLRAGAASPGRIPENNSRVALPCDLRIRVSDMMRTCEIRIDSKFSLEVLSPASKAVRKISGAGLVFRVEKVEKTLPAVFKYYAVLKTMPYSHVIRDDKKEAALGVIDEFEKKFGPLVFFTYGAVLSPANGKFSIDNRTLFLAKGVFPDEDKARAWCNGVLEREKVPAFPHPVRTSAPEFKIAVSAEYSEEKGGRRKKISFPVTGRVRIEYDGTATVADVEFGRGEKWRNFKNAVYSGPLELSADREGTVQIVDSVPLDVLLGIVVPSEIEPKSPYQAICAQAVAARTEILSKLKTRHTEDDFDFCAGTHCQAFGGLANRSADSTKAVNDTSGMIVMAGGAIVDTVYHANCGGSTERSNMIWSAPYDPALEKISDLLDSSEADLSTDEAALRSFIDNPPASYCSAPGACDNPDKFRWTKRFSQGEIDALVSKQFGIGPLSEVKVLSRGASGRIFAVELVGERSTARVYKELQIRKLFGMLRSALFYVSVERGEKGGVFVFRGAGWGHGVGMCQDGAKGMAISGRDFRQILAHYYSGSKVVGLE